MIESVAARGKTETKTRSCTVKQGATVPIGTHYQMNRTTCQAGPFPKIVQTSNPTVGKLIIEETKVEPTQKHCTGILMPGYIVRFAAGEKAGEEKITYDVVYRSKTLGTWKIEDIITVQWIRRRRFFASSRSSQILTARLRFSEARDRSCCSNSEQPAWTTQSR